MKTIGLFQLFILVAVTCSGYASADFNAKLNSENNSVVLNSTSSKTITLMPQDVFSPSNLDEKDNAQIVVAGYLNNACTREGSTTAEVNKTQKTIVIRNTANIQMGFLCAEVISPYLHTVNLGELAAGPYQIFAQDSANNLINKGQLIVEPGDARHPEDHKYASISDVSLNPTNSQDPSPVSPSLTLKGYLTSDCMHLREIKVVYPSSRTIEILPIVTVDTGRECHYNTVPFESKVQLENNISGSILIFVHSNNGQSLSKVINI